MSKIVNTFVTLLQFIKAAFYTIRGYDTPRKLQGEVHILKDGSVEYPGHMAFTTKGGEYFHGCRVARFATVRDLNDFFAPGNQGHLKIVGDFQVQPDGSLVVIYTNRLSSEDMEDIEEFNREMHQYFADKKAQREAAKASEREAKAEQEAQLQSDAKLGRAYRERIKHIKSNSIGKERTRLLKEVEGGSLIDDDGTVKDE